MNRLIWILIATGTFLSSLLITWLYRRYARARFLMDIPNDRSSHLIPTPRGGGIAIVISWIIAISVCREYLSIALVDYIAFIVPGIVLAMVSYVDDRKHIQPLWRLLFHIIVASSAVYLMQGVKTIYVLDYKIAHPWLLSLLAIISLVWLINLYNFMDGIDGIAGLTAISVSVSLVILLWLSGSASFLISVCIVFIASVLGFLWFNFPAASIFMGDIGSCFLGLILGLFILKAGQENYVFYWAMLILMSPFILDATITLIRRAWRGQKIYEAHREHAYQHLSRRYNSHRKVTLIYCAIVLLMLLPVAILVIKFHVDGFLACLICYFLLGILLWVQGAGTASNPYKAEAKI